MDVDRSPDRGRSASHGTSERSCYDTPTVAIRLTLPHRYDFGPTRPSSVAICCAPRLGTPCDWDERAVLDRFGPLRAGATGGRSARDRRAHARVDAWLRERGRPHGRLLRRRGRAARALAAQIDPERRIVLTDYAPETVARLRSCFPRRRSTGTTCSRTHPSTATFTCFTGLTRSSTTISGAASPAASAARRSWSWPPASCLRGDPAADPQRVPQPPRDPRGLDANPRRVRVALAQDAPGHADDAG